MVDTGMKEVTHRKAAARCFVHFPEQVAQQLREQAGQTRKGPVFQTAILAGVMAAKRTSELIPLCHPLPIEDCQIHVDWASDTSVEVRCTASYHGRTGVEMEALTGASVAALTVYDMCKALSHEITISDLQVLSKTGGKHDFDRETR